MKKVVNEDKTEYLSLKEKLHETLLLHFELELYFLFIAFFSGYKALFPPTTTKISEHFPSISGSGTENFI